MSAVAKQVQPTNGSSSSPAVAFTAWNAPAATAAEPPSAAQPPSIKHLFRKSSIQYAYTCSCFRSVARPEHRTVKESHQCKATPPLHCHELCPVRPILAPLYLA